MYPDADKHAAILLDKSALDKVLATLVESGVEFRVVQTSDSDNAWMLYTFANEVDYDNSNEEYNDSGCEYS